MRRPFSFVCLTALVAALALVGCAKTPPPAPDNVVAAVNGVTIDLEAFADVYNTARLGAVVDDASAGMDELAIRVAFLQQWIDRLLVQQRAAALGLSVTDQQVAQTLQAMHKGYPRSGFELKVADAGLDDDDLAARIRHTLLADKLAAREVLPGVDVSEEQLRAWYEAHPQDNIRPERVRARQIVCHSEDKAIAALTEVLTGRDFAEVAREASIGLEAAQGGDLGWFARGVMLPEIEEAAFRLPVGEISGVVRTDYGFHLVQVVDRQPETTLTYEQARATIRTNLRKRQADRAWAKYLAGLREKAEIVVHHARLLDF